MRGCFASGDRREVHNRCETVSSSRVLKEKKTKEETRRRAIFQRPFQRLKISVKYYKNCIFFSFNVILTLLLSYRVNVTWKRIIYRICLETLKKND